MEDFFYRHADRIISVSPGIGRILAQRGVPAFKVAEVPNGVGDDFFDQLGRKPGWCMRETTEWPKN
jgi:hypothetical protein